MNMGHAITEITERYHKGESAKDIAKATSTDLAFVMDTIKEEQINQAYEQHYQIIANE